MIERITADAVTALAPEAQVLDRLNTARRALAEARSLQEIKQIHAGVSAIREWLSKQRVLGIEVMNDASLVRLEAEARMGEMLARPETVRHTHHTDLQPSDVTSQPATSPPSHAELGIRRDQAQRWRQVAAVPATVRKELADRANQEGRELTQAEVLKLARKQSQPPPAEPTPLPEGTYALILADPPWQSDFRRGTGRDVENHYPTMPLAEIEALPVSGLAAPDCVLFLWATSPMLPQALQVLSAWGFAYKTSAVWCKSGMGMGFYFRQDHELLLVGTKGTPGAPEPGDRPSSVIQAPKGRHSEKPESVRELVERMYPAAARLEMFCRNPRPGWAVWGNEVLTVEEE